ncbi:MAG TPA: universal stress protein [Intrasporangium sp.]|uniref:universal stress protein n=1 Tax=Intrasporangium sp. TaxID=1925024 RepID=UPI002B458D86|nr:universal stress protein [Intrasporangium sp.]HKX66460.1 universal stress protein [Intrasporangium sp.]
MTGRIVVGIDGSEQSRYALEWAVARARLGGEELELLHAYSFTPPIDFFGYHGAAAGQQVAWFMEFSEEVLSAAQQRVRELAPELTCTTTSKLGHPAVMLAEASAAADVVVVGRRGLGGAASVLMGSVSNRLPVESKGPVVVVGDDEPPTGGPIVVGVDDSPFGTNALRYALAEAAVRKTRVRAVAAYDLTDQAIQGDPELVARARADVEADAEGTITRALGELHGMGAASVGVDRVAVEGRAADAILAHADDAQLVVVGTHGKGLVRRALLGSVSRQVLNDADRPVAIVDLPDS